jgi:hypothetical protein
MKGGWEKVTAQEEAPLCSYNSGVLQQMGDRVSFSNQLSFSG